MSGLPSTSPERPTRAGSHGPRDDAPCVAGTRATWMCRKVCRAIHLLVAVLSPCDIAYVARQPPRDEDPDIAAVAVEVEFTRVFARAVRTFRGR